MGVLRVRVGGQWIDVNTVSPSGNETPVGAILAFGGTAVPAGYLACNGAAFSRLLYAELFAAIGTTWGAGDGSTTFNVPDLMGRSPMGAGVGAGLTARTLAAKFGAEAVLLTAAESGMPTHLHSFATTIYTNASAVNPGVNLGGNPPGVYGTNSTAGYTGWNAPDGTVQNAAAKDATTAHNNIQPSTVVAFIIRATSAPTAVQSPSPLQPFGIVAMGAMTNLAGVALPANGTIDVTQPLVFTAQVGRRYRLVCRLRANSAPNGYMYLTAVGGPIGSNDVYRYLSGAYDEINVEVIFNGDGIQSTYKVRAFCNINASVWTDQSQVSVFYIEDVGPNQTPAMPIPTTYPAWINGALAAPWSNIGSGNAPFQYRKIGDTVSVRGEIRFTSPGGNPMFTFPIGFRPPYSMNFVSTIRGNPAILATYVNSDGTMGLSGITGSCDFSLTQFEFSVTP